MASALAFSIGLAPGCTPEPEPEPPADSPDFVSADAPFTLPTEGGGETQEPEDEDEDALVDSVPTAGNGDIYRVLDTGTILNLNRHRGLQVIDIANPEAPVVVGRLGVAGKPREMYVEGDRAIVLVNERYTYERTGTGLDLAMTPGTAVMLVDISDPTAPTLLSELRAPDQVTTSRLARRNDANPTLYLTLAEPSSIVNGIHLAGQTVMSVEVAEDELIQRTTLDFDGFINAVHAEEDVLLVARSSVDQGPDEIILIDTSDPSSAMVVRDTVTTASDVRS